MVSAVPRGRVVPWGEAVEAARAIGFPVTLKVSSAAIAHKTEVGGVALNLKSDDEVRDAAARLAELSTELLVEEMVQGAVAELIVGLTRDPQFGLALVIGAGGVLTELMQDTATLLLPTTREEIERALASLKVCETHRGFRGKSGDREAVIAAIEAVARFAAAHGPRIDEARHQSPARAAQRRRRRRRASPDVSLAASARPPL